jgi:hypothetical protein
VIVDLDRVYERFKREFISKWVFDEVTDFLFDLIHFDTDAFYTLDGLEFLSIEFLQIIQYLLSFFVPFLLLLLLLFLDCLLLLLLEHILPHIHPYVLGLLPPLLCPLPCPLLPDPWHLLPHNHQLPLQLHQLLSFRRHFLVVFGVLLGEQFDTRLQVAD